MGEHPTGVPLDVYREDLHRVPAHLDMKPILSFDPFARLSPEARARLEYVNCAPLAGLDTLQTMRNAPDDVLAELTLDELSKIRHSSIMMMPNRAEDLYRNEPTHLIVERIRTSVWKWGCRRIGWNALVAAYDGVRRFSFGLDGFEIRFDHAIGSNEKAYSEHAGIYLDGAMAFMVHHRGRHVMTIGFSVASGRRILIQQIQNAGRTGNRWLYRLPANRLEFVVDRFADAFPKHRILVADGTQVAERSLGQYRKGELSRRDEAERLQRRLDQGEGDPEAIALHLASALKEADDLRGRAEHIVSDMGRIADLYRDAGRHRLGPTVLVNGMRHHPVGNTAPAQSGRRIQNDRTTSSAETVHAA